MRSDNLRSAPSWITPDLVGRILSLAMPVGGTAVPVTTVPTRGVKPELKVVQSGTNQSPNPPVTHSRRADEEEAAITAPRAASPPRLHPAAATAVEPSIARHAAMEGESGPALPPVARDRMAYNELRAAKVKAQIEAERPLYQIAFERGIAIVDLAHALGQSECIISLHTRQAGFRFGKRLPLAEKLSREQLLAFADPVVPLPELRREKLKRERLAKWAKIKRDKRAPDVERRRNERQAEADRRRREREEAKAEARRRSEERKAARAAAKAKPGCEERRAADCQPVDPAPSREPAPVPPPARAQTLPDRARSDLVNRRRSRAVTRAAIAKAEEMLDSGQASGRTTNVHVKMALRAVEHQRAEAQRLGDPIEQAKSVLRKRYAPVVSMSVYGGESDLFMVGNRKNLTADELLAMAARIAA